MDNLFHLKLITNLKKLINYVITIQIILKTIFKLKSISKYVNQKKINKKINKIFGIYFLVLKGILKEEKVEKRATVITYGCQMNVNESA